MSQYYPQGAVTLKILFEDFEKTQYQEASQLITHSLTIIPRKLTVNINNYKTACTFDMDIEYKNFPFDPRTIRSCGVTIHMDDMKSIYKDNGELNKITPTIDNAILTGFVDEESITFNDSDRLVHFEGRDQTALLIDQKYTQVTTPVAVNVGPVVPTAQQIVPINQNVPLDQAIKNFLNTFPALKKLKVVSKVTDSAGNLVVLPTLASYHPDFGTNELAGHRNATNHSTYWDIIQDAVAAAGLIAYMRKDTLFISNARTLYSPLKAVKFIYGYNIKNLEYKRKLGRHRGFNVAVRSYNDKTKTPLTARIPYDASQEWCTALGLPFKTEITVPKLNPDGSLAEDTSQPAPYMALNVAHVSSQEALVSIGQNVFEDLVRQDIEGSLDTREMVAHSGDILTDNKNYAIFDLLQDLDIGEPISIDIYSNDLDQISRLTSQSDRKMYLLQRGYEDEVATLFAATIGKTVPVFYVKSIQYSLIEDEGFSMKISFINFLDVSAKYMGKS